LIEASFSVVLFMILIFTTFVYLYFHIIC
jgi:hypothetical protein